MSIHLLMRGQLKPAGGGGDGFGTSENVFSVNPATGETGDTDPYTFGTVFRIDANGVVTGVRIYRGAANTQGTITIGLYEMTDYEAGTLLASKSGMTIAASGWSNLLFDTPVTVTAGKFYCAVYHKPSGGNSPYYYYTSNTLGSADVVAASGNLRAIQYEGYDNGWVNPIRNGRFTSNATIQFPMTSSGSGPWYGVDIVYRKAL